MTATAHTRVAIIIVIILYGVTEKWTLPSGKSEIAFQSGASATITGNNLANGSMEAQGQKFEFKDGIAKGPQGQELKLTLDPATGDLAMEVSVNGKVAQKQTIPNVLTPQYLETFIFRAVATTNR